ncbi:putative 21s rrna (uridine -2 -o)-methyltransferase mrm2 protein [Botrytis cinerea BcDW1]|uniref:rRNA methyltransferase 2, mitochondrial n=1 Tax=Botryotinia fuckeliana (strain BcDW1) TaxID=1290391 RepID=M7U780_BOTF1|nr:putative 21s rrna (uridine -2 -o)-methyltransferase mrm2 protein [Botrytis cinerea BcDW1]
MLPPRLNPTISTSGRGILPRFHSCIPGLWNHKAGLAIARGRFAKGENGVENGLRTYTYICMRNASSSSSSSSSTRWKSRQGKDWFARAAKVKGLRSRAAFKLLEIDTKYKIFKRGQTVVDLGYAPGSWSQVAYERTQPHGRILGIDIIPAQPPHGVSTIQGNFLSRRVQQSVKNFLLDPERGRPRRPLFSSSPDEEDVDDDVVAEEPSYIDLERHMNDHDNGAAGIQSTSPAPSSSSSSSSSSSPSLEQKQEQEQEQEQENDETKMVHVVLSDMMMNTTGIKFSDHAGSMDLCNAALRFAFETLKPGGHFVCKFYQGAEDKELELKLRKMFAVVHREKPESSRSESKEAYFVALRRNRYVDAATLGYVNDV